MLFVCMYDYFMMICCLNELSVFLPSYLYVWLFQNMPFVWSICFPSLYLYVCLFHDDMLLAWSVCFVPLYLYVYLFSWWYASPLYVYTFISWPVCFSFTLPVYIYAYSIMVCFAWVPPPLYPYMFIPWWYVVCIICPFSSSLCLDIFCLLIRCMSVCFLTLSVHVYALPCNLLVSFKYPWLLLFIAIITWHAFHCRIIQKNREGKLVVANE